MFYDNGYGTAGDSHWSWDLRSRQCDACMPHVQKMAIRLRPKGTLVAGNGFSLTWDLEQTSSLSEPKFPSVRHVAARVTGGLSGQIAPKMKADGTA